MEPVALLTQKSPRFLYPELAHGETADDWRVASRLAANLWDSLPDARLAKRRAIENKVRILGSSGNLLARRRTVALHLECPGAHFVARRPRAAFDADNAVGVDVGMHKWRGNGLKDFKFLHLQSSGGQRWRRLWRLLRPFRGWPDGFARQALAAL